ncbi:MAG: hypothetical protein AUG45_03005 [Ktedonobacter sp. 13_1_20CM_3_54_15]|nr:MAG: hypothetical protein AUG45_03005 [Ktedonobacter sp. 13_1_20CM_3_54_15]TMC57625.1 MAG: hypothetical protein E6J21_13995 [Chloroflexota bacterium]
MPVSYTNRKGVTYTLYRGQTRTGKPRYYFGLPAHSQGEPVMEIPPGFTISESVNGVVSLVKDRYAGYFGPGRRCLITAGGGPTSALCSSASRCCTF